MGLFIMRRPGLLGLTGRITDLPSPHMVTISGEVELPVSRKKEIRSANIWFPRLNAGKMKLKIGDMVVCITKDNFSVEMLFDGAETPSKVYDLKGYEIRYTGIFDFPEKGETKEQHLFCGQVISSVITKGRSGKALTVTDIHIRSAGKNETRTVIEAGSNLRKEGDMIHVVTGPPAWSDGRAFYPVQAINLT